MKVFQGEKVQLGTTQVQWERGRYVLLMFSKTVNSLSFVIDVRTLCILWVPFLYGPIQECGRKRVRWCSRTSQITDLWH